MSTYRQTAISLARKAGKIILANFKLATQGEWKKDGTPVTVTDFDVNELVINTIRRLYPNHTVIGEEASRKGKSKYKWMCDPLDGTILFVSGIPLFAFSLALLKNEESILGVVYVPYMDHMFVAEKGKGATCNGVSIHVSRTQQLAPSVINLDGVHVVDRSLTRLPSLLRSRGVQPLTLSSTAYAGTLVANGKLLAAVLAKKNTPWDITALNVIVEEAGGKVTDLDGNNQRYDQETNGAIITNSHVHGQLLEVVQGCIRSA